MSGAGGGAGQQLAAAVLPALHRVRPGQARGRGAAAGGRPRHRAPPSHGRQRRQPGSHLLLPHVALAPARLRGLRGRVPAGPPLQLQVNKNIWWV